MCSSTALTTCYRGGTPRRRGAMRKTRSTAQPRQGRGLTATSMRTTALARLDGARVGVGRSLGRSQGGGGGGFVLALAVYKPRVKKQCPKKHAEFHSAAQPRAWADGDFDADHGYCFLWCGPRGSFEPGARPRRGGGCGFSRALAAHNLRI
jgi:hypothetical protein